MSYDVGALSSFNRAFEIAELLCLLFKKKERNRISEVRTSTLRFVILLKEGCLFTGGVLPLKEVSSANFLNGHALGMKQRRRIVSPSKPVAPTPAHAAPKLSVARSLKLRLDVPRRDLPLPEMIDNLAEHFDKCAKIPPLKTTEPDDKVLVPGQQRRK